MKVILEFDTTDPDQRLASVRAQKATEAYRVIREMDDWFRNKLKYDQTNLSDDALDVLRQAREELSDLQKTFRVDLEDLE
jgi:hypothetical protein